MSTEKYANTNPPADPSSTSLSGIAGGITFLTLMALIAGHIEARDYMNALGAPWASDMLSPVRLVRIGGVTVALIVLISIASYQLRVRFTLEKYPLLFIKLVLFGGLVWIVQGIALYLLPIDIPSSALGKLHFASGVSSVFLSAFAALAAIEGRIWASKRHPFFYVLTFSAVLFGLVLGAAGFGNWRGLRDADVQLQRLSVITSPSLTSDWVVVGPLDSGLLLMSPAADKRLRRFKVIAMDAEFHTFAPAPQK